MMVNEYAVAGFATAAAWAAVLSYIVLSLGGLATVAGLIITIIHAAQRRQGAVGYMVWFICAFVAPAALFPLSVWVFFYPASLVFALLCDATMLASIVILIVYLTRGSGGAAAAAERRCFKCGAVLQPAWPFCPFCSKQDSQQAAPAAATAPLDMPAARRVEPLQVRVSQTGQKTVVIGQKEHAVYAFVVVKEGANPGREFPVYSERTDIGRDGTLCQVAIDDDSASRQHAAIVLQDGNFYLVDLASRNGTFINPKGYDDQRIDGRVLLNNGDIIGVGRTRFVFLRAW